MPARLSLIVVSYRSASLAIEAIRSARAAAAAPLQVIAVDNSVDAKEAEALRPHADVLIASERNLGYGAAVNRARAKADGEILIVSNADVVYGAGSIDQLADADGEMCGPALFWDSAHTWFLPPSDLHTAGETIDAALASRWKRWERSRDSHRIRKRIAFWSLTQPVSVQAISGCIMAIHTSAFDRLSGFDERFHLYFEETDFQRRLRSGIVYVPAARCRHIYNQSAGVSDFAAAEFAKAEMNYLSKWGGRWAKSFERPRVPMTFQTLDGDIAIERSGLMVEASPVPSFETAAGCFPTSSTVALTADIRDAYRGGELFLRVIDTATARVLRGYRTRIGA